MTEIELYNELHNVEGRLPQIRNYAPNMIQKRK